MFRIKGSFQLTFILYVFKPFIAAVIQALLFHSQKIPNLRSALKMFLSNFGRVIIEITWLNVGEK